MSFNTPFKEELCGMTAETCSMSGGSTSLFYRIYNVFYELVMIIMYRIPALVFTFFSKTITISLGSKTILFIILAAVAGIYFLIRYKYHTGYSRLPVSDSPPKKSDAFDLQPTANIYDDSDDEPKLGHYPNEFLKSILSSIKIFGYLEEPVFNELSRYLNTKRVVKGDIVFDDTDTEKSFYVVIDGCVQVSAKRKSNDYFSEASEDSGEILLTEIKAGGTLSSLFTLLSLFTENVKLRRTADQDLRFRQFLAQVSKVSPLSPSEFSDPINLVSGATKELALVKHKPSMESPLPKDTPLRPNIIAKATADSTLAVIPAEAFQKLTQKFPNATAHIVQVILTRFQRVTYLTLNNYLGMSKELLKMEKKMTELANYGVSDSEFNSNDSSILLEVARKTYTSISRSSSLYKPGIASSASVSVEANHSRDNGVPPVLHLKEQQFVMDEEELAYQSIRQRSYDLMTRSLGMIPDVSHVISQAGDLSRAHNNSESSQDNEDENEYSSGSNDESETMSSSATGAYSPSSFRSTYVDEIEFYYLKPGSALVKQGERLDGLYLVIYGAINVSIEDGERPALNRKSSVSLPNFGKDNISTRKLPSSSKQSHKSSSSKAKSKSRNVCRITQGCVAGYLGAVTGCPSFVNMVTSGETVVAYLSRKFIDRLNEKYPNILLTLAKRLIHQIPPLLLQIDFALDWVQASSGKVLCRQGEVSDSIYIVLNGRLRTIAESTEDGINIVAEYGQGDSVGELEVLTNSPRPSTLHAIRDSELACMPKSLFDAISLTNPEVTIQISRMIAKRTIEQQSTYSRSNNSSGQKTSFGKNNSNLKTVAILPVRGNVPIQEFSLRLRDSLNSIGESAQLINSASVHTALGKHAFTKMGKLKVKNWLVEQEERNRIVLLTADGSVNSPWTRQCIRQADCILLVGIGSEDSSIGEFERLLISCKTTARKELVLLHADRSCPPGSTQTWLKSRMWIHAHHHIQFPLKRQVIMKQTRPIISTLNDLKDQFNRYYADVSGTSYKKTINQPSAYSGIRSDFSRLARRLCGKSIGLVLGGGGARGLAHLGFLRAMEEAGIPIDIVGGCSIGAYIGGLYARDSDTVAIFGPARMFSNRMASIWRKITDLTYPVISWFSGHEFNRGIWKSFSDTRIEDLWLPYYCVTTNITHSRLEIHQSGYLWRYVRASMSLSGFLPPMCDGNNLLLDGGYLDYLPVEVMRSMGVETIFALDVAGEEDSTDFTNYGDSLSGWYYFFSKLNPFSSTRIMTLAEIQSRLAYVSSVSQLEAAKKTPGCHYIRLPVQSYGTLEFGSFQLIEAAGYSHGQKCVQAWDEEGLLLTWTNPATAAKKAEMNSSRASLNVTPGDVKSRLHRRSSM